MVQIHTLFFFRRKSKGANKYIFTVKGESNKSYEISRRQISSLKKGVKAMNKWTKTLRVKTDIKTMKIMHPIHRLQSFFLFFLFSGAKTSSS